MTVTTSEGATVTLVRTGVDYVGDVATMGVVTDNGVWMPLLINLSGSSNFVGEDWGDTSGGDADYYDDPYVCIINGDGDFVNPQLLTWLMRQGATFENTFTEVVVTDADGNNHDLLTGFVCTDGVFADIVSNGHNIGGGIGIQGDNRVLNCALSGFSEQTADSSTVYVSNNPADGVQYANRCVVEALGGDCTFIDQETA